MSPTVPRIGLAAVTAWLLPSLVLANIIMVGDAFTATGPDADMISAAVTAWMAGPVMGLLYGWPFLLAAFAAWALLHHWKLVRGRTAAGVGALCGVGAGIMLGGMPGFGPESGWLFAAPVLGMITGLAVWRVAYGAGGTRGQQDRPA
ncbi:MAG TPA: hypothetical protein VEA44_04060 [Caulobacter sp.]|nr:hypothetical protein [Caulobacter sp.]